MAGRILNRRELRNQVDHGEQPEGIAGESVTEVVPPGKRVKRKSAAPKVKKPRKVKAPPRMRACWGIFDGAMKQVAIFDYNQRAAADQKLSELLTKNKGIHFLQVVKEPMPEPAPVEAPAAE